ncbi:MAG: hypothetical protein BWK80_58260 [Desulfobacteraceae bacterium IS3]|nr:MAG: hypothetical protein BWK80_58260 [Desulfobacteraceae bacterium IS3]
MLPVRSRGIDKSAENAWDLSIPSELRFCKTTLQVVLSAKRFAKSFYRKSGLRNRNPENPLIR